MTKKPLILYYSQSQNTEKLARIIQSTTGADLCKIEAATPYPKDYEKMLQQVQYERENHIDPPYKPVSIHLENYDTIFIGSPNWSGCIALPLATYLKEHNWQGKTIYPFLSHGGAGKEDMESDLAQLCPRAHIVPCYETFEKPDEDQADAILEWIHA